VCYSALSATRSRYDWVGQTICGDVLRLSSAPNHAISPRSGTFSDRSTSNDLGTRRETETRLSVGASQLELWTKVDAEPAIEGTIAARNVTFDLPENDHGVKCCCRFTHSRLNENGWRWGSTWTEGRGCQELLKRPAPLIRVLERGLLQVMKDHICISKLASSCLDVERPRYQKIGLVRS
jgi:hypothetical protein